MKIHVDGERCTESYEEVRRLNPDADYRMVVEHQRRLEALAASRAGTPSRVLTLLTAFASRIRTARP